jgi:hypothetical protein
MKSNNSQDETNGILSTSVDKWRKNLLTKSKSEIVNEFRNYGFACGEVISKIRIWKTKEYVGLEVGRYEHSCHVDTTELIVLLILDYPDLPLKSFSDNWLTEVV